MSGFFLKTGGSQVQGVKISSKRRCSQISNWSEGINISLGFGFWMIQYLGVVYQTLDIHFKLNIRIEFRYFLSRRYQVWLFLDKDITLCNPWAYNSTVQYNVFCKLWISILNWLSVWNSGIFLVHDIKFGCFLDTDLTYCMHFFSFAGFPKKYHIYLTSASSCEHLKNWRIQGGSRGHMLSAVYGYGKKPMDICCCNL